MADVEPAAVAPRTAVLVVDDGTAIAYHRWEPDAGVDPDPVPVVLQHGFSSHTLVEWADHGTVAALTAAGRVAPSARPSRCHRRGGSARQPPGDGRRTGSARRRP